MLIVVFGIAYSYGQFLTPLSREFGMGAGTVSALFSVNSLIFFCLGAITGPLADRIGLRRMFCFGALIYVLGLVATSFVFEPWQAYLTYGIGTGLGIGAMYVPVVSAVGRWFEHYRALASGIAFSGIGLGTVIGPPAIAALVDEVGWRVAFPVCGSVATVALLVVLCLLATPPAPVESATAMERHFGFGQLYVSALLLNCALYVPFVHLSPSALSLGLTSATAALLVSVVGGASIAGRILLGAAATRWSTISLYLGCYGCVAASLPIWATMSGFPQLMAFAAVFGVGYGGYIALTPVVLAELYGTRDLSTRLGLIYTAIGLGASTGPLATGLVVQATGAYSIAIWLLCILVVGGLLLGLPLLRDQRQRGGPRAQRRHGTPSHGGCDRGPLGQNE